MMVMVPLWVHCLPNNYCLQISRYREQTFAKMARLAEGFSSAAGSSLQGHMQAYVWGKVWYISLPNKLLHHTCHQC